MAKAKKKSLPRAEDPAAETAAARRTPRRALWVAVALINLVVLGGGGYLLHKNFGIMVYSKKTSEFMQTLQGMQVEKEGGAATGQEAGGTWMDLRRPHPYGGFRARPFTIFRNAEQGVEAVHNDRGFRSPELKPKQPGTFRLAMVGGSVVWAGGSNDSTIVARLARLLERRGLRVEYVNAGVSSAISNQEVAILVNDLLDLDVDLVVALDGYNDISHHLYYNGRIGWPPMRWDQGGGDDETLGQAAPAYYPFTKPNPHPGGEEMKKVVRNWGLSMLKMEKICSAFRIQFLGVLQPYRDFAPSLCPSGGEDPVNQFYCEAQRVVEGLTPYLPQGVALVSLADLFTDRKDLFTDAVHFHGTATRDEGNQLMAEKLLSILLEKGFVR